MNEEREEYGGFAIGDVVKHAEKKVRGRVVAFAIGDEIVVGVQPDDGPMEEFPATELARVKA